MSRAVVLVLAAACGLACGARPQDPLFQVQGERQEVARAFVFSLDNDNRRFQAVVYTAGARLEPGEDEARLVLGTETIPFHGSSSDPAAGWTRYLANAEPEQARRIAAGFDVALQRRAHPGHDLRARLEVLAPLDVSSPELPARFHLRNAGDAPIAFLQGGRYRNPTGRDNRFSIEVARDGVTLPDPGPRFDRGGLGVYVTLRPGEQQALDLDLRRWCDFDAPGVYEVALGYELDLRWGERPAGAPYREAWNHLAWDDVARASLELELGPVAAPLLEIDGVAQEIEQAFVVSGDNANLSFDLHLRVDLPSDLAGPRDVVLVAGVQRHVFPGLGYDGQRADASLRVSAGQAAGLAAALGVPLQRREHFGQRLVARFEPVEPVSAGAESVPARFVLENAGEVPVGYLDGGHNRNELGRDNRFTFTITRDGEPVEPIEVFDFGGLAGLRTLAGGERQIVELDLAHWCGFEQPGTYRLQALFVFQVSPEGWWQNVEQEPWPARAHRQWDETLSATVEVRVE